ncbi:MAG: response regulator [Candidatus Omnitrophica bacterium]|nr:response regulator [Candidatus Omnitrophota bacterium]
MSCRILIVDDAAFMRATLKDVIIKGGFEVVGEAVNGKDAIDKYQQLKPDIVTMDITMPEMDGLDALKSIVEINAAAKVVMVSAIGQQSNVLDAVKSGAKDFIVKPFQPERVVEALKKVAAL